VRFDRRIPCRNARCDRIVTRADRTLCPACYQIMVGGALIGAIMAGFFIGGVRLVIWWLS